jgi:arylsulfatase A-like enzyme
MKRIVPLLGLFMAVLVSLPGAEAGVETSRRPNVILIMTDDQGYGDLAAHGNRHIQTPHMDRLRSQSVRLENFHVDPTCSPTRAALMTGRYSGRVGVWHTVMGRSLLRADEKTMARYFREAGYGTAIFGKWHLGDHYPYGAKWRGFDDAIVHFGGGVGQAPDYWDNDYFEDHYFDNGQWAPFQGYCTDVWFREALRFIQHNRDRPFFVYLPTNAAHQTHSRVPERYAALYQDLDVPDRVKRFWGMISNIDDNLGVLLDRLERWGLMDHTILIFMGDNGTTLSPNWWPPEERPDDWADLFNAGMRGIKGSHYDGGHRVFCFLRHPAGGFEHNRDIHRITAHIDLLPTLLELCGIEPAATAPAFDGVSIVPLLRGRADDRPGRVLVVENQRVLHPQKWRNTAVMTDHWRLIDNRELYNMHADPGQQHNVIDQHPEVVARLRASYEQWWNDVSRRHHDYSPLYIGAPQQNPVTLSSHDWHMDAGVPPWHQDHVRQRQAANGPWTVNVVRGGRYELVLRERPEAAKFALPAERARVRIGEIEAAEIVEEGATGVRFELELPSGQTTLQTWLIDPDGTQRGAYYVDVRYLGWLRPATE